MRYINTRRIIKRPGNPFLPNQYVFEKSGNKSRDLVKVCDLEPGDVFLTDEGKEATVSAIQKTEEMVTIWTEGMNSPIVFKPEPRGELVLKEVTNVFRGETYEWLHVVLSNGEELKCTREHPYSVKGKGWVAAGDLQPKDELVTADGRECLIDNIWIEKLDTPETTYNIEVEGCHNYFVGNSGILVHNICVAEEGSYKAIVNQNSEHGLPHAHILKDGQRMAQIDKLGQVSKGAFDHGASKFVNRHWDKILKGIIKYFPKK